jgi:hypothetical protein
MTRVERLHQRAKDAVADCLVRYLQVPQVYFEAQWPSTGNRVDILAIDRAGVGDVHVIEVAAGDYDPRTVVKKLMSIPAQFRWMAVFPKGGQKAGPAGKAPSYLYPIEDMGRIGVIEVVRMADDSLGANIRFKAERFRGNYSQEVDQFAKKHRPDIEFR